jgi:chromosome segregation ATPase
MPPVEDIIAKHVQPGGVLSGYKTKEEVHERHERAQALQRIQTLKQSHSDQQSALAASKRTLSLETNKLSQLKESHQDLQAQLEEQPKGHVDVVQRHKIDQLRALADDAQRRVETQSESLCDAQSEYHGIEQTQDKLWREVCKYHDVEAQLLFLVSNKTGSHGLKLVRLLKQIVSLVFLAV